MPEQKTPSAEDHWDALVENNPDAAHAFALGLARIGVPLANFFRHTNSALAKFAMDPNNARDLLMGGPRPAGEKFVPDTAILHPGQSEVDTYIRKRYGER
jgi:hypothetical protein